MNPIFDVVIAGAGPGGCAAALSLKSHAPQLRVCLVDHAQDTGSLIGEAASPQLRPLLEQLALWQAFQIEGQKPVYRSRAAWGGPRAEGVEFFEFPLTEGWTLERAGFNRFMLHAAEDVVDRRLTDHVALIRRGPDGLWQLGSAKGTPLARGRVVIDATGRAGAICRLLGARAQRHDRLIGYYASAPSLAGAEPGVLLETCAEGWWYTAELPGARRVVAFMGDADLTRKDMGLDDALFWEMLNATRHIRHVIAPGTVLSLTPHPAASQVMRSDLPHTILPVGDAAACFDPIAGSGIVKALRGGIFASYAIADHLLKSHPNALGQYHAFRRREWDAYRITWRKYYAQEQQFPHSPFWQRRQMP